MSARRHLAWIPPLLVGAATAVAAEVALGVLLYAGTGLIRALSTVLVVEGAAFSVGLWSAPRPGPDLTEQLRRRWMMCLIAFVGAAIFGVSWTAVQDLGQTGFAQGIGLAVLAAFPLYTTGSVLGGLAVSAASHDPSRSLGTAAPAALGAALGFAATGLFLPRAPMPSSLLIGCLVLLSLSGLVYGAVLSGRMEVEVKATRPTPAGPVTVEDRRQASADWSSRTLSEGTVVRRQVRLEKEGRLSWEVAAARSLMPGPEDPWRVLIVGGGASSLPRTVLREHPTGTVDVLERVAAVVELGRDHFQTELSVGSDERWSVRVGNVEDLVEELEGFYDLVLVDAAALAPLGGSRGLSKRSRLALARRVTPDGALIWGPSVDGVTEPVPEWFQVTFSREGHGGGEPTSGEERVLVLSRTSDAAAAVPDGFQRVNGDGPG